jgi:hypothetical protein
MERLVLFRGLLVLLFLVHFFPKVLACTVGPDEFYISNEKMVVQATSIYLAKLVSKSYLDKNIHYSFDIKETIKGEEKSQVNLTFSAFEYDSKSYKRLMSDFDLHKEEKFWKEGSYGRSVILTDCEISNQFQLGYVYLIFPELLKSAKGFEMIESTNDKWYQTVHKIAHNKSIN